MRLGVFMALATLAFGAMAPPAMAWDVVGVREVADRTDRDTIHLEGDRLFSRIKLCVFRRPVHFIDVDVHFENGGHQDVSVAQRINAGACTRAIDLEGGARNIDRIVMVYEETSFRRRTATVRVMAE